MSQPGSACQRVAQELGLPWLMIALLVWLSAACSTNKWSHPTAGDQQLKADDSECEKLAANTAGGVGYPAPAGRQAALYQSMRVNQVYQQCMMGKGWVKP